MDHARAAQTGTATEFGTGEFQAFPDYPQQRRVRRRIGSRRPAIYSEVCNHVSSRSFRDAADAAVFISIPKLNAAWVNGSDFLGCLGVQVSPCRAATLLATN
jgi:hypothetical protein